MAAKRTSPLLKRLGVQLRRARHAQRLSQEAVAHAARLDRAYVSGLERGEFNVSVLVLARLARVLDVSLTELLANE